MKVEVSSSALFTENETFSAFRQNSFQVTEASFKLPAKMPQGLTQSFQYHFCLGPCLSPCPSPFVGKHRLRKHHWLNTNLFLIVRILPWCKVTPTVSLHFYYYMEFICDGFIFV